MQIIIANWKEKDPIVSPYAYMTTLSRLTAGRDVAVTICPPLRLMAAAREAITGFSLQLGTQDCTLPQMAVLASLGCHNVILGHSDWRASTDTEDAHYEALREKLVAAVAAQLQPIFCVGEHDQEDDVEAVLRKMMQPAMGLPDIVVAYEPVWAIGTGRQPNLAQISSRLSYIKKLYSGPTIYGGSVNADNARKILGLPEVDGVLVGGASLDPAAFAAIVNASAN